MTGVLVTTFDSSRWRDGGPVPPPHTIGHAAEECEPPSSAASTGARRGRLGSNVMHRAPSVCAGSGRAETVSDPSVPATSAVAISGGPDSARVGSPGATKLRGRTAGTGTVGTDTGVRAPAELTAPTPATRALPSVAAGAATGARLPQRQRRGGTDVGSGLGKLGDILRRSWWRTRTRS